MGKVTLKNGIVIKYNKLDVNEYWNATVQLWNGDCLLQTLDKAYTTRELVRAILTENSNVIMLALDEYASTLEMSAKRIRTIINL